MVSIRGRIKHLIKVGKGPLICSESKSDIYPDIEDR